MKKTGIFLLSIATMFCFSFSGEVKEHLLKAGEGMDDSILFGKTRRADIIERFGNDFTIQHDYFKDLDAADSSLSRIFQCYTKLGLTFVYMAFDTTLLRGITISKAFPAITANGIKTGNYSMQEIELLYGQTDWQFTDTSMFKAFSGIAFAIPFDGIFPVSEAKMKAGNNKAIYQIDIYNTAVDINR